MTDIVVPKWGLTMEEAVVLRWLKAVGETVAADEAVLELETDKVTSAVVSPVAGVLAEVLVSPDDTVVPGQVVGRVAAR